MFRTTLVGFSDVKFSSTRGELPKQGTYRWRGATIRLQNLRGQSASPDLFKQLETSIKKTQKLLRKLGTFPPTEDIEFDMHCYLEEGTITVATQKGLPHVTPRDSPPLGSYPELIPSGATMATINRQRVLDRLVRDLNQSQVLAATVQ